MAVVRPRRGAPTVSGRRALAAASCALLALAAVAPAMRLAGAAHPAAVDAAPATMLELQVFGSGAGSVIVEPLAGGQEARVPLHFGHDTEASDVALALAGRLQELGVTVTGPAAGGRTLFLSGLSGLRVATDGNFRAQVTAMDGAVSALRAAPVSAAATDVELRLTLATASPHDGTRDLVRIEADATVKDGAPGAAARLAEAFGAAGGVSERPGGASWRPIRDKGGREVVGVSAAASAPGWRLEVEL